MDVCQDQLYRRCACKLESVLSKRDYDLRILVGHSNLLQDLTPAFILESDGDVNDDDNDHHNDNEWGYPTVSPSESIGGSNFNPCSEASEHVEDLFPVLREVSFTANKLPSDEVRTSPIHQCVIEKSHTVLRPVFPAPPRSRGPLCRHSEAF
jgi:hypothetical protein